MRVIEIPEFQMSIEELDNETQSLAKQKVELTTKILQIDVDIAMISAIITVKALKELGRI